MKYQNYSVNIHTHDDEPVVLGFLGNGHDSLCLAIGSVNLFITPGDLKKLSEGALKWIDEMEDREGKFKDEKEKSRSETTEIMKCKRS